MAVLRKKKRHQLRMHALVGAEVSPEEAADKLPVYRGIVAREMDVLQRAAPPLQIFFQFLDLRGLPCPIQAF